MPDFQEILLSIMLDIYSSFPPALHASSTWITHDYSTHYLSVSIIYAYAATSNLLKSSNDGEVGSHVDLAKLLVNHKSKNTNLGSTAVVELNCTLGELGLLVKGVPAKVKST
eukprot:15365768-Ditylum_brightwellii.AAC.1